MRPPEFDLVATIDRERSDEVAKDDSAPIILIVDDTPENLSLLSELLQPHYQVRAANSGRRALQVGAGEHSRRCR